jgi:hypothetical protein
MQIELAVSIGSSSRFIPARYVSSLQPAAHFK